MIELIDNNCKQQITAEQKKMTPKQAAIKDFQSGAHPTLPPTEFTIHQDHEYYAEILKLIESEIAREDEELRAGI